MKKIIILVLSLFLLLVLYSCDGSTVPTTKAKCAKGKVDNVTGISLVDNKTVCTGVATDDDNDDTPPEIGGGAVDPDPTPTPEQKPPLFFGRNLLSDDEKKVYDELQKDIPNFTENKEGVIYHFSHTYLKKLGVNIVRGGNPGDRLNRVANLLLGDDKRLFYLSSSVPRFEGGYTCGNDICYDKVMMRIPDYYTRAEYEDEVRQIKVETDKILAKITPNMSDAEKAKILHDNLLRLVNYGMRLGNEGDIKGAFINKTIVCEGYAAGLAYLLQLAGIPAIQIFGDSVQGNHAWVKAYIDGEWYNIDPTWDDAMTNSPYVYYEHFLLSDKTFFDATHGHRTEKFSGDTSSIGFPITLPVAPVDHPLTGLGINRNDGYTK